MSDKHENEKRPHGVTGDTVQQAAEVSKPTSDVGRALDDPRVPQAPHAPATAADNADGRHTDIGTKPAQNL